MFDDNPAKGAAQVFRRVAESEKRTTQRRRMDISSVK